MFPLLPLPIRVADGLKLEMDPGVSSVALTPAEALGLGDHLIRHAVRRNYELRRESAAALRVALGTSKARA